MKIVFLSPIGQMGGAERCLADLMASLRAAKSDWTLELIAAEDGPLVAKAREMGVISQVMPFPPALAALGDAGAGIQAAPRRGMVKLALRTMLASPAALRYARGLRRSLRLSSPDIVHSNGSKMHLLASVASNGVAPVVWHIHDFLGRRLLMRRLLRLAARRCSAVLANSNSVAADSRGVLKGAARVFILRNAVDLDRLTPDGSRVDIDSLTQLPPASEGTVRVGLVATYARWKGHEVFFRALAQLPETLQVRAYVVGGPVYQTRGSQYSLDELRAAVTREGLEGKVGFTGNVPNVAAVMRSLDVVVHASVAPEPFGLVIAEAMACGRAVIASEAAGALEFVEPDRNALTHAPGDAVGLARSMARLIESPELRRRLGEAGRRTAEERFDRARLARDVEPVYAYAMRGIPT